jgi:hypothetical protein
MFWKRRILLIFIVLLGARFLDAADLPAPLKEREPALTVLGSTTLHWFGIHVYDIALYTQGNPYTTNTTAVLSLRYAISIKHKKLQETTLQEWKRLGQGTPEQRQKWIDLLDTIWPDIKSGQSLSAFRQQDGPTAFYFGDRLLGEVSDAAFGPAFFAIWLDKDCRYPKVRKGLLEKEPGGSGTETNK